MSRIRSDAYAVVHPHQRARAVRLLELPSRNVLCEGDPLTGLCGIRMVVRTYPATHPNQSPPTECPRRAPPTVTSTARTARRTDRHPAPCSANRAQPSTSHGSSRT